MRNAEFSEAVYAAVRSIPPGRAASYGQIARMCAAPRSARAVGRALHANPDNGLTPCHRVVTADGRCSGAFAFGGENVQRAALRSEGVGFSADGRVRREFFI